MLHILEAGRPAAHELDRFLTTPGTIATMAPLLGLLGTIIGMIEIFGSQGPSGMANPAQLAHGISIALYNAACGFIVAVPSLFFTVASARAPSLSSWNPQLRSKSSRLARSENVQVPALDDPAASQLERSTMPPCAVNAISRRGKKIPRVASASIPSPPI